MPPNSIGNRPFGIGICAGCFGFWDYAVDTDGYLAIYIVFLSMSIIIQSTLYSVLRVYSFTS